MNFDYKTELKKIATLKSPIIISSGTFGTSGAYLDLIKNQNIGAVVTKTITMEAKSGNPQPRIFEGRNFIVNSIGLENNGVDDFVINFDKNYKNIPFPIIVSISGNDESEYVKIIKKINELNSPIAVELNLSCPNVNSEGLASAMNLKSFGKTVLNCSRVSKFPIITKLSPFQCINTVYAETAEKNGTTAISLINTVPAMAIDTENMRPFLGNTVGGMSGPAIKPIALKMAHEIYKSVTVPIIGMGGISNYRDALDFLMVGATAVSIGTMNLVDPELPNKILENIDNFFTKKNIRDFDELKKRFQKNL